jgi:hypothetical protein
METFCFGILAIEALREFRELRRGEVEIEMKLS